MDRSLPNIAPYAKTAVKLLQGPIFQDQSDAWEDLLSYQVELRQYFEKIALKLLVDKGEGYAFLQQMLLDEKGTTIGLMRRTTLTYELTLVCVLLREWLDEFERDDLDTQNLYISPLEFRERMELFFKERTNELKFIKELNRHLDQCAEMGFVKLIHKSADPDENRYEVRRILKARITGDELLRFKAQLEDEFKSV